MAKPLKILLFGLGGVVALLIVALVAAALLFDPNDYRGQIASAVREETGRELELGNIQLKIFPWLRVAVFDARLSNAAGFGDEPMAQLKELSVGVKLLPLLFSRKIEVSAVTLDGLHLNLAVDAAGRSNWQDILDRQAAKPAKEDQPKEAGGTSFDLRDVDISSVTIRDTAARYVDAQKDVSYAIRNLELKTGPLRSGKPFDLDGALDLESASPAVAGRLNVKGRITPHLDRQQVEVENLALGFDGKGFDLDLDAELKGKAVADLGASHHVLEGLTLQLTAAGTDLPGGKQTLGLQATKLDYDGAAGTLQLDGAELKVADLRLKTVISGKGLNTEQPRLSGPIAVEPFNPRALLASLGQPLQTADAKALAQASLSAQYSGSFKDARLDKLTLVLDQTTATGHVHIRDFATMAIDFALKVDDLNADRYLPPKATTEGSQNQDAAGKSDIDDIELPTEALEKLNANGTLDIGKLVVSGLTLSNVRLKLSGSGENTPRQQDLSAQLYGGKVSLSSRVTPGSTPGYALKTQLSALQFEPFLKDFLDKDMISGVGNLTLDVSGRGNNVGQLRRTLNGSVGARIENGAVKGFNLGEILRQGEALLDGNLNYKSTGAKETDFAAISVSGRINNGILSTDDLNAASPAFRVTGAGTINLVNETLDYLAKPTVVETSRGQGGKELESLKGVTIPIKLTGSLHAPKYKIDLEDALKQKAKEKIREELKGKEDELKEKLNEKLGDFLFGKQKKPVAPAPGSGT